MCMFVKIRIAEQLNMLRNDLFQRIGSLIMVFLAGGVTNGNLIVMMYGEPNHYDASVGKVIFAIILAVVFGWIAIYKKVRG